MKIKQRIDAILACRVSSTRLYGKPLQYIDMENRITILEYLVSYLREAKTIGRIILAAPDNDENYVFKEIAKRNTWEIFFGDEKDMLGRILGAANQYGTDVIIQGSTESPFMFNTGIDDIIRQHVEGDYDYSQVVNLPEGSAYAIFKTDALAISHRNGDDRHRSELVSSYIFDNQNDFKILQIQPENYLRRSEVRITVDYPEDLIFCRQVFKALSKANNLIRIEDIVKFWDDNPELRKPLETIGIDWGHGRIWE